MPLSLRLSWNNGSVPPRYRTSSVITLDSDGTGTVVRTQGYGDDDQTSSAFALTAPEALAEALREGGLWRTEWRPPDRRAVGGPMTYLTATLDGEEVTVPPIVAREQRDLKKALVQTIQEAVLGA